ncbi:DUF559 domain-containing protein [Staphylococcus chromogenes]|nr:DUF559 domain-containing protein [Staphylococcus chromogenes]
MAPTSVAVVDILQSIFHESTHSPHWYVPSISGLTSGDIRAIEIIDASRFHANLTGTALAAAAKGRFLRSKIDYLGKLSDAGAQSPRETYLRLMVRDLADWKSQYKIFDVEGIYLTAADLACEETKVALFYDGEHHLQRSQRDYDSEVVQRMRMAGWEPMRITNGQLKYESKLRDRVSHYLNLGRRSR